MTKEVEETRIYQKYLDFICYIEMITEKYPRSIKVSLVPLIKNNLYDGIKNVLSAYKAYDKTDKLKYLNKVDIDLKMLKIFARISYKKKYISVKNYEAWSRKINNVGMSLGGFINSCLKH